MRITGLMNKYLGRSAGLLLVMALLLWGGGLFPLAAAYAADDFIIAVDDPSGIYYAKSNGDGTFSDYQEIGSLGGGNTRGVTISDFNSDGSNDFIVGRGISGTAYFYLFLNDGNNNFTEAGQVGTLSNAYHWAMDMASGDFNNDGRMDFIANGNHSTVGLFLWDDTVDGFTKTEFNWGYHGRGMDVADFDNDGNLDIVRARNSSGYINVYWGDGVGSFSGNLWVGDSGNDPYGVVAGDFNNDGKIDIIANDGGGGNPYLWTGNGDRTFTSAGYVSSIDFNNYGAYDAFDFNSDGNLDIVAVNYSGRRVYYFPGNGNGTFGLQIVLIGSTISNCLGISAMPIGSSVDVDGDGIDNDVDNCPLIANPDQADTYGDPDGDACDDFDGDGIFDRADNCPEHSNPAQEDLDADGEGDMCDFDKDGDGIDNDADNCPLIANANQIDSDGNGVGDMCGPQVIAVPWFGNPNRPHEVFSGGTIVLQAAAIMPITGEPVNLTSGTWDPGDGSGPQAINVSNPRVLELEHAYNGAVGQPFTAFISVTDTNGDTYSDTFKVVIRPNTRDTQVNMAIDKGLWHLHKRMNRTTSDGLPSGYWTGFSSYHMAATAGVVQAFEINNHLESGNRLEDPYVDNVARGLRYILSQQHGALQNISVFLQNGNDPDGNGNGYGLWVNYANHASYLGGQFMDAIIASGTPDKTAETGMAIFVKGRTYKDIVQDMLDGYSYGMNDSVGGWHYSYNSGSNDTSASHWWAIGVLAAEVWGLDAPQWVKDIQWNVGVPLMQRDPNLEARPGYPEGCYFGYTYHKDYWWGDNQTNVTAAGLILMNADDIPKSHLRFTCAEKWLDAYFNASLGNFYTMYQTAKAMRTALDGNGETASITLLNGTRDWYAAYADYLINNQNTYGTGEFQSDKGSISRYIKYDMATSWALIMLSPSLFELPPVAECNADPTIQGLNLSVDFDGSGSWHQDPNGQIVSYDWDFDDGNTGSGQTVSHSFAAVGVYNVTLTVTDGKNLQDSTSCPVEVVDTGIPPNANTGGPYTFCQGEVVILDGSGSSDADGSIVSYEWDLTAPVNFSTIDATGASVNATAFFPNAGTFDVGLLVTDDDPNIPKTGTEFTTVTILPADDPSCNQPPVAVCQDVTVSANDQCQGDANINNGSSDPDGDPLTFIQTPAGPYSLGDTSPVTLTVSDGQLTDTCTATVTVVDKAAPTIDTAASDLTVECDGTGNTASLNAWLASNGGAVASDNCSNVNWSNNFKSLSDGCGGTGSTTVTFTATDDNNNTASTTATFTIVDTTLPSITTPASDKTVECDGSGNTTDLNAWLASNGGAVAGDTCSGVTWSNNFKGLSDDCGATGSATVTFTATDDCGKSDSTTATFTIVDTTLPSITTPASDKTVECDGAGNTADLNAWLASNGGAVAGDTCSGVTWSNNFKGLSDDCGATGSATVTFTATDDCGKSTSTMATFTIVDTTPPAVTAMLVPVSGGDDDEGLFKVEFGATDICDTVPIVSAVIEACGRNIPVTNGQKIGIEIEDDDCEIEWDDGRLQIEARSVVLKATAEDCAGNVGSGTAVPQFRADEDNDKDSDRDSDNDKDSDRDSG